MNLVSREKAIDIAIDEYNRGYKEGFEAASLWIPCSERLPEESGKYLVTREVDCGAIWKRVYLINYSDLIRTWWRGNVGKSDCERLDDVTAWMPLPEPYKERREE